MNVQDMPRQTEPEPEPEPEPERERRQAASEGDLQQRDAVIVEAVAVQHNQDEPGSFLAELPPVRKATALSCQFS